MIPRLGVSTHSLAERCFICCHGLKRRYRKRRLDPESVADAVQTRLQHLSRRPNSDWWAHAYEDLDLQGIIVFRCQPNCAWVEDGATYPGLRKNKARQTIPVLSDYERKSLQRWHKKPLSLEWFSYHSPKHPSVERRAEVLLKTPDVRIWWNNNRHPNAVKISLPQLA